MSKLTKLVENARRGGQGFGFMARQTEAVPGLILIASLPASRPELVKAAIEAGADALVLSEGDATTADAVAVQRVVQVAGDRPCGLAVAGTEPAEATRSRAWQEAGVDFLLLSPGNAAGLLLGELEKVAKIRADCEATEVRALDALGMDAFVVERAEDRAGARLSIADAARYRLLTALTGRPVFVGVENRDLVADLENLAELGVEGVLVGPATLGEDPAAVRGVLESFRSEITRLGPRKPPKRRQGQELPLIPRVAPPGSGGGEEEPGIPGEPDFPE